MSSKPRASKKELAESAYQILFDIAFEVQAGRILYLLALKHKKLLGYKVFKDIFEPPKKMPNLQYLKKLGFGGITIALYKYQDLWKHQLTDLLDETALDTGKKLASDVKERKIPNLRNQFIAHYAGGKKQVRTPPALIESWLKKAGVEDEEQFLAWTNNVVESLFELKAALKQKYNVKGIEVIDF